MFQSVSHSDITYTPFEKSVIRLVAEVLDKSPRGLSITADLQEIGYSSIDMAELKLYVEDEFEVEVADAEFAAILSILDLCQLVAQKKAFGPEVFSSDFSSIQRGRHRLQGFNPGILLRSDGSPGDKISVADVARKLPAVGSGALFAQGGIILATSEDAPQWLALLNRLEIPSRVCAGDHMKDFIESSDQTVYIHVVDVRKPIDPRSAQAQLYWVSALCQRLKSRVDSTRSPGVVFHDCISYISCNYVKNLVESATNAPLLYIVSELDEEVSINSFISTGHDNREDLAWLKANLANRSMAIAQ